MAGAAEAAAALPTREGEDLVTLAQHAFVTGMTTTARIGASVTALLALLLMVRSQTPAADRLQHLVRAFAGELMKNPDRAPLALELLALARTIPDIRTCFDSHHEQFVEQIATLLTQMGSSGAGRSDTHTAALASASMIDGMVLRWTLARSPFDLESALWEATQVLFRGMTARQPRAE